MAATNSGLLGSASIGASATIAIGPFTLPENTLCFLDVKNFHAVPANLSGAPSVAGTGGETWHPLPGGGTTTAGGASPTIRHSRFYTMVAADAATTVTSTFSPSQQASACTLTWVGGVDCSGVDGAGALGQTPAPVNGAGASVTTLSIALGAFLDPRNGAAAGLSVGQTGGVTQRGGWTEPIDFAAQGVELQYSSAPDSAASFTQASAVAAFMACETKCTPHPIDASQIFHTDLNTSALLMTHSINLRRGCVYILHIQDNAGTPVPAIQGLPLTKDQDFVTGASDHRTIYRSGVVSVSAPALVQVTRVATGNYGISIVEVSNVGSLRQLKAVTFGGIANTQSMPFDSAVASRNSGIVAVVDIIGTSGLSTALAGWQIAESSYSIGTFGIVATYWRANAQATPVVNTNAMNGTPGGGVVYEFLGDTTDGAGSTVVEVIGTHASDNDLGTQVNELKFGATTIVTLVATTWTEVVLQSLGHRPRPYPRAKWMIKSTGVIYLAQANHSLNQGGSPVTLPANPATASSGSAEGNFELAASTYFVVSSERQGENSIWLFDPTGGAVVRVTDVSKTPYDEA